MVLQGTPDDDPLGHWLGVTIGQPDRTKPRSDGLMTVAKFAALCEIGRFGHQVRPHPSDFHLGQRRPADFPRRYHWEVTFAYGRGYHSCLVNPLWEPEGEEEREGCLWHVEHRAARCAPADFDVGQYVRNLQDLFTIIINHRGWA